MVDLKDIVPWLSLAVALIAIFWPAIRDRGKNYDTKLEAKADALAVAALAVKVDAAEDRITRVESDLQHLPDKEITHRLEMAIGDLRTEMRGMTERMKPIGAMAERIQERLLENL